MFWKDSLKHKWQVHDWADRNDHPLFFDTRRRRNTLDATSMDIRIIHPRSPSSPRGRASPADRENVSSSKRQLLINISSGRWRPGWKRHGDSEGWDRLPWLVVHGTCRRSSCLPCFSARVYAHARTRSYTTHIPVFHVHARRAAETTGEEERKGCGRGSVPLGHWWMYRAVPFRTVYTFGLCRRRRCCGNLPDPIPREAIAREKLRACRRLINRGPRNAPRYIRRDTPADVATALRMLYCSPRIYNFDFHPNCGYIINCYAAL